MLSVAALAAAEIPRIEITICDDKACARRAVESYKMFQNMRNADSHPQMIAARSRQISELQSDAAGVVAQTEQGPIEIRRYSEPVAYLESVEQHREHQELDAALDRAIWALDLARAMADLKAGKFKRWDQVSATLRARYPKP